MSKLLKQMLLLAAGMAAAAGSENLFATGNRSGSHFDTQAAREKNFNVHDRDNDRQLRPFNIKGKTIMAYSKKDAIIRLKHQNKRN